MRLAIVYNENDIYAEFNPDDFKKLLKKYFEEYKDIDKAFDKTSEVLKTSLISGR